MTIGRRGFGALAGAGLAVRGAHAASESNELRISYLEGFGFLPNVVAERRKLIEKHAAALGLPDVKVSWQLLRSAIVATDAMLAGKLDLICGTTTSLLVLWDKTNGGVKALVCLGGQHLTLVTRNPNVKTVGDFGPGDRIAVPSVKQGPHSVMLGIALEKQLGEGAWNKLDSIQVQMGHNDALLNVLNPMSEVNSHFSTLPYVDAELAATNVKAHKVIDIIDIVGGPVTTLAVYGQTRWATENPLKAKAVVAAIDEANDLIVRDTKGVAADYLAVTGEKFEVGQLAEMISRKGNLYASTPVRTDVYAKQMYKTGLIKKLPASWKDYHSSLLHDRVGS